MVALFAGTWILLLGCLWLSVAVAASLGPWLGLAVGACAAVLVLGAVGVIGFLAQPGIGAPGTRFGEAHLRSPRRAP